MHLVRKTALMEQEIEKCVRLLRDGKVILYPTDTIWGIGCDATNEEALLRVYEIKQRDEKKSMIILLDSETRLPLYVQKIPQVAWELIPHISRPTTFIYPTACNLPKRLIYSDGTIAIRIVRNDFCKLLIRALDKPIISTSANRSTEPTPPTFDDIDPDIIRQVDYVVPPEYADSTDFKPSRLIKFLDNYNFIVIRD